MLMPPANDAMRAKILSNLHLSEQRLKEDVVKLRDWLKKQIHLPQDIGDEMLLSFIMGTKSLEIAKDKLERFFSVKNAFPTVFADRDPMKFIKPDAIQQFILPGYTKEGYSCFIVRIEPGSSASNFDHLTAVKKQLLLTEHALTHTLLTSGIVAIYDVGAATTGFLTRFNLSYNLTALKCYQDNYPLRIKKIILMNAPSFAIKMFETLIRPLLKPKFAARLVIIAPGDKKTIFEHVPEEIMPKDMGGTAIEAKILNDVVTDRLEKERDWCISTQDLKSNESKRVGKPKFDFDQGYGVEGTFRTLTID